MSEDRGSDVDAPTMTPSQVLGEAATGVTATTRSPSQPVISTGALPARYALTGTIGAGGMGEVLLANDRQIDRDVAIKRMRVEPTPSLVARFVREAKIQGRLDHPSIVPVHDLATDAEGRPFFVMKRLAGTTLAEIIAKPGSRTRQKLLRAFADVCLAIEFAHERRIIHRDLKPANIMLGDYGEVYVLDWGVARMLDDRDEAVEVAPMSGDGATELGAILGTPGYMAPEQRRGQTVDERADVFALGSILFEILAGESHMPRGRAALEVAIESVDARPSLRSPTADIPPELDDVCVAAMAALPGDRPSARDLAARIEKYLDGDRDIALRRSVVEAHIESARAALAEGDSARARATAMREAGRAIAIDPRAHEAAELVARLMLEPPRETPPEVARRIDEIDSETTRDKLQMLVWTELAFLMLIPAILYMGLRSSLGLTALIVAIALNVSVTIILAKRQRRPGKAEIYASAATLGILTILISRMFTPFLMAPGIAALTVLMFALDPVVPWVPLAFVFLIAALLPWIGEVVGILPDTTISLGGDLLLRSDVVSISMPDAGIALAIYTATMIFVAV
jgi:eukaryotic-like serine/threonine-protein kinase